MMVFNNGRFVRLDEDMNVDVEKTMEMNIREVILNHGSAHDFNYHNTRSLVSDLTKAAMKTIKECKEEKKSQEDNK